MLNTPYLMTRKTEGSQVEDEGENGGGEAPDELNDTKLRMIPDEVEYDDDTKAMEEWWLEDTSREMTQCALWKEEKSLYVLSAPGQDTSKQ